MSYGNFRFMHQNLQLSPEACQAMDDFNQSRLCFFIKTNHVGVNYISMDPKFRYRNSFDNVSLGTMPITTWEHGIRGFLSKAGVFIYTGSEFSPIPIESLDKAILVELGQLCVNHFDLNHCDIYTGFEFPWEKGTLTDRQITNRLNKIVGTLWKPAKFLAHCIRVWGIKDYADYRVGNDLIPIALSDPNGQQLGTVVSYDYIKEYMETYDVFPDNIYFPYNNSTVLLAPASNLSGQLNKDYDTQLGYPCFVLNAVGSLLDLSSYDLTLQPIHRLQIDAGTLYNCATKTFRVFPSEYSGKLCSHHMYYGHQLEGLIESRVFDLELYLKYRGVNDSDTKMLSDQYNGKALNTCSQFREIYQELQADLESMGYSWDLQQNLIPYIQNTTHCPCIPDEVFIHPQVTVDGTYAYLGAHNKKFMYFNKDHLLCEDTSRYDLGRETLLDNGDRIQHRVEKPSPFVGVDTRTLLEELNYSCTMDELIWHAKKKISRRISLIRTHLTHALLTDYIPGLALCTYPSKEQPKYYLAFNAEGILEKLANTEEFPLTLFQFPAILYEYESVPKRFMKSLELGMTLTQVLSVITTLMPYEYSSDYPELVSDVIGDSIERLLGNMSIRYNKSPTAVDTRVFDYIDVDWNIIGFMSHEDTSKFIKDNKSRFLTKLLDMIAADKTFIFRGYPITAFQFDSIKLDWKYKCLHVVLKFKPTIEEVKEHFVPPSELKSQHFSTKRK